MKKNPYYAFVAFLLAGALALAACSKDDPFELQPGTSAFTMKVDGAPWEASMTALFTEELADSEQGEFYHVYLSGSREAGRDPQTGDGIPEMMHLYVAIPASKYRNPKGTYPVALQTEKVNHAALFYTNAAGGYAGSVLASEGQPVGVVEITGFEIGQQWVSGQPVGTEGYTRLAGTFQATLMPTDNPNGAPLKITDGKFDLSVGILIND